MIRVFYGDDRERMMREARRLLRDGYEVVDGDGITSSDLVNLFNGVSLFEVNRKVLLKDLAENKEAFVELPKYCGTGHEVILIENKLDKRSVVYKEIVAKRVEVREFRLAEAPEKKLVFDILDVAMRGEGKRAVEMVEKIELSQDAYMFFGLMVSQAIKKLGAGNRKAREVISLLAETDFLLKSSVLSPWLLVKRVLVSISGL